MSSDADSEMSAVVCQGFSGYLLVRVSGMQSPILIPQIWLVRADLVVPSSLGRLIRPVTTRLASRQAPRDEITPTGRLPLKLLSHHTERFTLI